ncbi:MULTISPECIES: CG0192-related protein [unclassified Nocardioides]|uniref:CG0192-related protein n=1 Tax=unclassified Nocardioides TaxID=2615069 RepID=UPI003619F6A1
MALLHHATLTPTKPELLATWIPRQPWAEGLPGLTPFGGYRLDDPAGEVGMEGIMLRSADGSVVAHVPLTYRAEPLEGAEDHLVGTTEHSVLGTRWVYDATGDPVWIATVTATVLEGGSGAEEYFKVDGRKQTREPKVAVTGSGETVVRPEVVVVHEVGTAPESDAVLHGRWDGGEGVLVVVRSDEPR